MVIVSFVSFVFFENAFSLTERFVTVQCSFRLQSALRAVVVEAVADS